MGEDARVKVHMQKPIMKLGIFITLLFIGVSVYFTHKGFSHVMPQSMMRWARQKWNEEEYIESIKWFSNSYETALNAGFRWTVAEYYFQRIYTDKRSKVRSSAHATKLTGIGYVPFLQRPEY